MLLSSGCDDCKCESTRLLFIEMSRCSWYHQVLIAFWAAVSAGWQAPSDVRSHTIKGLIRLLILLT